jgi:hypothetical protein
MQTLRKLAPHREEQIQCHGYGRRATCHGKVHTPGHVAGKHLALLRFASAGGAGMSIAGKHRE